jgi:hypothetical protein
VGKTWGLALEVAGQLAPGEDHRHVIIIGPIAALPLAFRHIEAAVVASVVGALFVKDCTQRLGT